MKCIIKKSPHADIRDGTAGEIVGYTVEVNEALVASKPGLKSRVGKPSLPVMVYITVPLEDVAPEAAGKPDNGGDAPTKPQPKRIALPDTRPSHTHKFDIKGNKGYISVGLDDTGQPVEIFVTLSKNGSTVGGAMNCFARALSIMIQTGVPLRELVDKFAWHKFEPSGPTPHPKIPYAHSIVDYIARFLGHTYIPGYNAENEPK